MQVKNKIPKVPKVFLNTEALGASEVPSTDSGTKQNNKPQPSDFKCTDTLLPSSTHTNTEEIKKRKFGIAASVSEPLESENRENRSESQQNDEPLFVTEVIYL